MKNITSQNSGSNPLHPKIAALQCTSSNKENHQSRIKNPHSYGSYSNFAISASLRTSKSPKESRITSIHIQSSKSRSIDNISQEYLQRALSRSPKKKETNFSTYQIHANRTEVSMRKQGNRHLKYLPKTKTSDSRPFQDLVAETCIIRNQVSTSYKDFCHLNAVPWAFSKTTMRPPWQKQRENSIEQPQQKGKAGWHQSNILQRTKKY
ncbi:hypothetical protein Nepgr_033609 [Nepenthes gracilis]|uniref:Uncharacterized protein n=1 Tax=Nepenthes gracilis TaxID=150966 RepID=A0AAD3TLH4_NEPGR|nr:hypothetical protein Nepgr_033609 [Nepenthes gracilis]